MVTHQELYDALMPLIAELIKSDVVDRNSLASTYARFASVGEQEGKDPTLLLTLASEIRQKRD